VPPLSSPSSSRASPRVWHSSCLHFYVNLRTIWSMLRQTFTSWSEEEAPRLGAALAFYTILSLAPLVILAIAILGQILGRSTAEGHLLAQIEDMVGPQGAEYVKGIID